MNAFRQTVLNDQNLGMVSQSLLDDCLPLTGVFRGLLTKLQEDFGNLRKAYENLDENVLFDSIPLRGLDPQRIDSRQISKRLLSEKAALVNKYSF